MISLGYMIYREKRPPRPPILQVDGGCPCTTIPRTGVKFNHTIHMSKILRKEITDEFIAQADPRILMYVVGAELQKAGFRLKIKLDGSFEPIKGTIHKDYNFSNMATTFTQVFDE